MSDNRALRLVQGAARRAHQRTYSSRATRVAQSWQYPDGPDRLVPSPVFVLSPMRSGSTLLRRMLDAHTRICAPHEMHLGSWKVESGSAAATSALATLGLDADGLADLLWDRVLHLQLLKAGKSVVVDKTPRNTLQWERIAAAWPDARFLVLLRHPQHVVESLVAARPDVAPDTAYAGIERYALALHAAQNAVRNALTVRYEDLVGRSEETTRRICTWLGVPWEPTMIAALESGRISPQPVPDAETVPSGLRKSCELLGYL